MIYHSAGVTFFFILILASAITSLLILLRRLPAQNVVTMGALILVISGAFEILSAKTGFPFPRTVFHRAFGLKLFGGLPWFLPFVWMVVLLNGRAIAELILRGERNAKYYGYGLLIVSWVLAAFLFFNFEWHSLLIRNDWKLPRQNEGGMAGVFNRISAMPLFFLTMTLWVIDKKSQKSKTDFSPLVVWLLLNLYFFTAALLRHFFAMAAFIFCITAFASVLAFRKPKPSGLTDSAQSP